MTQKNRWQAVLAGLTLTLLACDGSIISIPEPVAEAAPAVEAESAVALMTNGDCFSPGANLISWWPGDGTFDDIAEPIDAANNIGYNSVNGLRTDQLDNGDVTFESGLVGQAFSFTPITGSLEGEFLEIPDADDLKPAEFTIDLWAKRTGPGLTHDDFGNVLIQKDAPGKDTPISYGIWWNDQDKIKAWVNYGGQLDLDTALESDAPNTPEWVHIALTADGSTTTTTLYVNGVEDEPPRGRSQSTVRRGSGRHR